MKKVELSEALDAFSMRIFLSFLVGVVFCVVLVIPMYPILYAHVRVPDPALVKLSPPS